MHPTLADRRPVSAVGYPGNRSSRSSRTEARAAPRLAAVVALALAAVASLFGCDGAHKQGGDGPLAGAQAQPGDVPPRKFDDATAATWKEAGAQIGWMGLNKAADILGKTGSF